MNICGRVKRPAKFAFVGAIGILVQLLSLHWLVNDGHLSYLFATAVAVEAAVFHNFLWHENFTWSDRQTSFPGVCLRLLRFHLSNGVISLAGNIVLMRMFAGFFGIPLIPANLLSITICCVANFFVSDRWVFAPTELIPSKSACAARMENK